LTPAVLTELLESYYLRYNIKRYISPDPLELVYHYDDPEDREVAGLISSSFALGRVRYIVSAAGYVLRSLGNPGRALRVISESALRGLFSGFKYRFFSTDDVIGLLLGIGGVLRKFGTLENCFQEGYDSSDGSVLSALRRFVQSLYSQTGGKLKMLPDPELGSACKRLHLFLRWMVRCDEVDPGVWHSISPATLLVPMDVHMHRISHELGMTDRKQADAKTALEVTDSFKAVCEDDPVRYDFCLTRRAIHPEL
jgi:uncharacterized protein (TIGR02757 family)